MKKSLLVLVLLMVTIFFCSCSVKNKGDFALQNDDAVESQVAYAPGIGGQYLSFADDKAVAIHGEAMSFNYAISDELEISSITYAYETTNENVSLSFQKSDNYHFITSITTLATGEFEVDIICNVTLADNTQISMQDTIYIYAREDFDFASLASLLDAKIYCYLYLTNPDDPSFLGYYAFFGQDEQHNISSNCEDSTDIQADNMFIDDQLDAMSSQYVTVYGYITWIDDANMSHPAAGVNVRMVQHNGILTTTHASVETDENGFYSATIPYSAVSQEGINTTISVCSQGGNISVFTNTGLMYELIMANISNYTGSDLQVNYEIDPNDYEEESKSFAYVFRIHQAMNLGACYVETLTGSKPATINIYYPTVFADYSYYNPSGQNIHVQREEDDWDVLLHEYGHYVADYYNIDVSPGGAHQGPCENVAKGKENGMAFAWSEGWATYFSISSQIAMNASSYGIDHVGDTAYTDTDGKNEDGTWKFKRFDELEYYSIPSSNFYKFGESNEFTVAAVLLDLADNTPLEDGVNLGFTYIWNVIMENECQDLSEFINALYANHTQSSRLAFGEILSAYQVSPLLLSPANEASDNWLIPSFSWTPQGGEVTDTKNYENNLFSLAFFDNNNNLILETPETTNAYYTPTNAEWTQIINSGGSHVFWCVKAKQTSDDYVTGWYYSNHHKLNLSTPSTLTLSSNISGYVDESYYSNWYKFVAPYGGVFSFETTGLSDPYGELFSSVVYGQSFLNRLENGYDDNSGEDYNFKIEYEMTAGEVVYLRVRDVDWGAVGIYNLTVTCVSHEHEYEYVPLDDQYHIRKCACGVTYGVQSIHTVDTSVSGKFKPCIQCGIYVNTSGGGGIIVPGINSLPVGEIPNIPTVDNGAKDEEEPTNN